MLKCLDWNWISVRMVDVRTIDASGRGRRARRVPVGPPDGLFNPDGSHSAGPHPALSRAHHGADQLRRIVSQHHRSLHHRCFVQHLQVFMRPDFQILIQVDWKSIWMVEGTCAGIEEERSCWTWACRCSCSTWRSWSAPAWAASMSYRRRHPQRLRQRRTCGWPAPPASTTSIPTLNGAPAWASSFTISCSRPCAGCWWRPSTCTSCSSPSSPTARHPSCSNALSSHGV